MTEGYTALHERQRQELGAFLEDCSFFAFNDSQFNEGLRELGIEREHVSECLSRLPGGGYILKSKVTGFKDLVRKQADEIDTAIDSDPDGLHFVTDMFYTELTNHEYGFTRDTSEALEALGMDEDDITSDPKLYAGLIEAVKRIEKEEDEEE